METWRLNKAGLCSFFITHLDVAVAVAVDGDGGGCGWCGWGGRGGGGRGGRGGGGLARRRWCGDGGGRAVVVVARPPQPETVNLQTVNALRSLES